MDAQETFQWGGKHPESELAQPEGVPQQALQDSPGDWVSTEVEGAGWEQYPRARRLVVSWELVISHPSKLG